MKRALGVVLLVWLGGCGARPVSPSPPLAQKAAPAPSSGRAVLEAVAHRASDAGASPLSLVATTIGSEGERVGAFVDLPKTACLLVTAAGSSGVADIDLFAFDDDGTAAGADESPSSAAAILLCPPHPDRVYLSARIVSGGGVMSIGAQEVAPDRARAVAAAVGARGRGDDTGRLDSWPGLEAKLRDHRAAIGARWEDVRRLAAPLDPRAPTRTSVTIEPKRCVDVLVTPSDEVASLEVVAETPDGRIAARAQSSGRDRTLLLCSETGESLTIAMRPRIAQGVAAVIVGRSLEGAEGELSRAARVDRPSESLPLVDAERALDARLTKAGWTVPKPVGKGQAKVGSRAGLDVKIPQGCARLDVVAGAPLGPVKASLWDDRGGLLSEGEGGGAATLFACGAGATARVDVEAQARPGPFSVWLRPFRHADPALVHEPVAASRLLGRLDDEGVEIEGLGGLREVKLSHAALAKETIEVKEHTCREVLAALDTQGSGLELRLLDDVDKTDSIVRARFVVSDHVCAGATPKHLTAELRLTTGEGSALVVSREIPLD